MSNVHIHSDDRRLTLLRHHVIGLAVRCVSLLAYVLFSCGTVYAQVDQSDTSTLNMMALSEGEGDRYMIGRLELRYVGEHPEAPPLNRLMQYEVLLGLGKTGYIAPRADIEIIKRTIEEISYRPAEPYYGSALRAITEQISRHLKDRYRLKAQVKPDPSQIDGVGDDLRGKGSTALRLNIMLGVLVPATAAAEDLVELEPSTVDKDVASEIDGPVYEIGELKISYLQSEPQLPLIDEIMKIAVPLGVGEGGYIAPRSDVSTVDRYLEDIAFRPVEPYYASAIQAILEHIRDYCIGKGLMGVYVAPDPLQIDESGNDLRPSSQSSLQIIITIGLVTELRSVAAGERIAAEQRVDHLLHERIKAHSPIQSGDQMADHPDHATSSVLNREVLDDYVYRLSRHPGRRVDVAVSAAEDPGGIALDYIVTENRPWSLYAQLSNTGTKQTNEWQQRFGFYNNQLTNNDDIFNLQYLTAGFEDVHAVAGSYELPLFDSDRLRMRFSGSWSEYTAADIGFFNDTFTGQSYEAGGELIANLYQDKFFFIDAIGGVRYQNIEVENTFPGSIPASESFLIPYLGLAMEQRTEWFSTYGMVQLDLQSDAINSVDPDELNNLGRNSPDEQWIVLGWDFSHSVYLEPLVNRDAWNDSTTPESSTLAHELYLAFKGQYAFDYRLIPQAMQVLGGIHTVRGYPESAVAADTILIGKLEYRFHLPRIFAIEEEPRDLFGKPFRVAPQYVYGQPDWDLALRGFADIGHATNNGNGSVPAESDDTLLGTGIGLDFTYKRNVKFGLDWGFALRDTEDGEVQAGSNRMHVLVTVLY